MLIILIELGVPYEIKPTTFQAVKEEPFLKLNPNGRAPAIEDPNTGMVLWESGAIIEYLLDMYDKEGKLSYQELPERYQQSSWKHFQMSGQVREAQKAAIISRLHVRGVGTILRSIHLVRCLSSRKATVCD